MPIRSTQTTVHIEDLRIEAYVGHGAPERSQPQVVSITIAATLGNPVVPNDELGESFDYVPIVREIKELAMARPRKLIETFAEEIAEVCLANARVQSVVVSVRKPHKLPAVAAVGVERTFERG